mmetsp:Transcript_620/g.1837  ORF Transcript_620/g.1837 Transcript_620/m.1837 type:complete len:240 (+) Transcript_620:658-1377(+)
MPPGRREARGVTERVGGAPRAAGGGGPSQGRRAAKRQREGAAISRRDEAETGRRGAPRRGRESRGRARRGQRGAPEGAAPEFESSVVRQAHHGDRAEDRRATSGVARRRGIDKSDAARVQQGLGDAATLRGAGGRARLPGRQRRERERPGDGARVPRLGRRPEALRNDRVDHRRDGRAAARGARLRVQGEAARGARLDGQPRTRPEGPRVRPRGERGARGRGEAAAGALGCGFLSKGRL